MITSADLAVKTKTTEYSVTLTLHVLEERNTFKYIPGLKCGRDFRAI